jgi:hypothetical protein
VAVAAIPAASESGTPQEAAARTTAWERLAPVIGTIATGIGVVGFVTFVGAVILSARLHAAGFPAETALGVVPAQDMLVIGAETLVPTVIWGLVAVGVAVVFHIAFRTVRARLTGDEARLFDEQMPRLQAMGVLVCTAAVLVGAVGYSLAKDLPADRAWLLLVAVVAAFVPAAIARLTSHLAYVAVATFLIVGVFLTWLAYQRASVNPQYRGAAVIRENKTAAIGFFVAESSSRVYLARTNIPQGSTVIDEPTSRLVGIEKSQITDWGVGAPKRAIYALAQAKALARELCQIQPQAAPAARQATTAAKPKNCWTAPAGMAQP